MKVKTSELDGAQLDWAVGEAQGLAVVASFGPLWRSEFAPSIRWAQAGPIIEREHIEWRWLPAPDKAHQYGARKPSLGGLNRTFCMDGPTILIAAMRCYVASKLGEEVEVPNEIV